MSNMADGPQPKTLYQKLEAHRPESDQDRWRRALYFSTALGIRCLDLLSDYMRYCLRPNQQGMLPEYERDESNVTTHHQAVKELIGLSIWLTLVDQLKSDVPPWLRDFFLDCWSAADKLYPEPSSHEIMNLYEDKVGTAKICESVSSRLCYKLKLEDTKGDACIKLGEMLEKAGPIRSDLLLYAMSAPLDALDKSIDQLKEY